MPAIGKTVFNGYGRECTHDKEMLVRSLWNWRWPVIDNTWEIVWFVILHMKMEVLLSISFCLRMSISFFYMVPLPLFIFVWKESMLTNIPLLEDEICNIDDDDNKALLILLELWWVCIMKYYGIAKHAIYR